MVNSDEDCTIPRLRNGLHTITLQQGSLGAEFDGSPAGQSETDDAWRSGGTAEPGVRDV